MSDSPNLGLQYGVLFDVETGGNAATEQIKQYNEKWKQIMAANPLNIEFGISGRSELGETEKSMRGTKKAIDETNWSLQQMAAHYQDLEKGQKLDAMKKRLDEIKKSLVDLGHLKVDPIDEEVKSNLLNDLKTERLNIQNSYNSLAGGMKSDMRGFSTELTQANFGLLQLGEQLKQDEIAANRAAEALNKMAKDNQKSLTKEVGSQRPISLMNESTTDGVESKLQRMYSSLERLNELAPKIGFNDAKMETALSKTMNEITRLEQKLAQMRSSFGGAGLDELLKFNPKNLEEANALIAELTKRRSELNRSDSNYLTSMTSINQKHAELSAENKRAISIGNEKEQTIKNETIAYQNQSSVISNLKQMAVTYLSLYEGIRLIKSIAEITGQFEMQQRSLEAILQSADKAKEIFSQTKALAVVSPYQFKDLLSYTKQLAAYRIETDQLFNTMKNLADVSSGLGVDMNRIILAYGQVNAASVLRGQELRQFTEAGIPLVSLLADKFGQLEGRAVSTGEVFDKISKRLVPFQMIKEIFGQMTSEGGIFFNMQEIQAETLEGKISNLKDAYEIMFNSMGSTGVINDALKGTVDLLMETAKNWEKVAMTLAPLIISIGGYKAAMLLAQGAQKAQIAYYGINEAYVNKQLLSYDRQVAAEARKAAAINAGITISRAKIITEGVVNELTEVGMAKTDAKIAKEAIKNLVLKAGNDEQKKALLQSQIAILLMEKDIEETVANATAKKLLATATEEAAVASKGLWASMMTNPFGWAVGALSVLASLGLLIYNVASNSSKLKNELIKIDSEGSDDSSKLTTKFVKLSETIVSTNSNTKEHRDALMALQNTYKEMLPAQSLTTEGIIAMGGAYENATGSIEEFVLAKTKEKQIDAVNKNAQEENSSVFEGLSKNMRESGLSAGEAKAAITKLQTQIESGKFTPKEGTNEAWLKLRDIVASTTGKTLIDNSTGVWLWASTTSTRVGELTENLMKARAEIKDIESGFDPMGLVKKKFNFKGMELDIKSALGDMQQGQNESPYQFNQAKIKVETDKLKDFLVNTSKKSMSDIQAAIDGNPIKFDDAGFQALWDMTIKRIQTVNPDRFTKSMNDMVNSMIPVTEQAKAMYNSLTKNQEETSTDYLSRIDGEYKVNLKKIEEAEKAIKNHSTQKSTNGNDWQTELTELSKVQKIRKEILDSQGMLDFKTKKKTGKDPRIEALEEEIKMIEDAKKKYDELIKAGMSSDKAKAKIQDLYGSKLNEKTGKTNHGLSLAYDTDTLVADYERYIDAMSKLPKTKKITFDAWLRVNDIQVEDMVKKLKAQLKTIEDDFSSNKKRVNIFDSVFSTTGDASLADKIASSFEGKGTTDMGLAIKKALNESFDIAFKDSGFDASKLFKTDGNVDFVKAQQEINKLTEGDKKASAQKQLDVAKECQEKEIEALLKGLQKFDDFESKRTDIVRKEEAERFKIKNSNLPQNVKDELTASSLNRENKDMAKISKEQFKSSELWQTVFTDLDRVSGESIGLLKERIGEYIKTSGKDLAPTEMKEMVKTLDDLQKRTAKFDLASVLKVAFRDISPELEMLKQKAQEAQTYYDELKGVKDVALGKSVKADQKVSTLKADPKTSKESYDKAIGEQTTATNELSIATKNLNAQELIVSATTKNYTTVADKKKKVMHEAADAVNGDVKSMTALKNSVGGVIDAFYAVADAMGLTIDPTTKAILDAIVKSLGAMVAVLSAVAAMLLLVDVLCTPLLIIAAVLAAIIAAFAIIKILSLKGANDEIEKQANLIKALEIEYKSLENRIKSALGSDYINLYNQEVGNLGKKIEATRKQLAAENSKGKDKDKDKVAEYEASIVETQQAIIDKQKEFEAAIVGSDLTTAAKDFASAWIDAYDSFANTTDAMSTKFKEMMRNMVVNTMLSKIMDVYLAPVYKLINEAGKDGKFTLEEMKNISTQGGKAIADADAAATTTMEGLGDFGKSLRDSTSNLSGVSKGISTITEETATILGGYLDSIRFRLFAFIDLKEAQKSDFTTGLAGLMVLQNKQVTHLADISANTLRGAKAGEELLGEIKKVISVSGNRAPFSITVTA